MQQTRPYKAAAIGNTGHVGPDLSYIGFDGGHVLHLPYQYLPGVEMVAVADTDETARLRGMAAAGAARAYADYQEMLTVEKPFVVSVCSRQAERHEEAVIAAAEAGCHVFVDKPMAADLESADRMIAACERAGVRLCVAHQTRYVEPFLTAKNILDAGRIGRLLSMQGRGKEDHRGGGEDVICCGVHTLDTMRMFAGDPLWVSASVTVGGRDATVGDAYEPADRNGLVAGDSVHATFGFSGGVLGHMTSIRNQHLRGDRWGINLIGSEGVIAIRYGDASKRATLKISNGRSVPEEIEDFETIEVPPEAVVPGSPPLESVHMPTRGNRLAVWDLIGAAEQGRDPIVSGYDGRWTLEMAHGIYASHLARRRLPLPLVDRRHPLAPTTRSETAPALERVAR